MTNKEFFSKLSANTLRMVLNELTNDLTIENMPAHDPYFQAILDELAERKIPLLPVFDQMVDNINF